MVQTSWQKEARRAPRHLHVWLCDTRVIGDDTQCGQLALGPFYCGPPVFHVFQASVKSFL